MSDFFFFNDTATTEIYTLSLHDALPISPALLSSAPISCSSAARRSASVLSVCRLLPSRSEEHTSELQSRLHLVCRLLLEKNNDNDFNALRTQHVLRRNALCYAMQRHEID